MTVPVICVRRILEEVELYPCAFAPVTDVMILGELVNPFLEDFVTINVIQDG